MQVLMDHPNQLTDQPVQPISVEEHASRLGRLINEEIIYAFGGKRNGWAQRLISPFLRNTTRRFGHIAADFYDQVNRLGISQGASVALSRFKHQVQARGPGYIPMVGPLLLVSNHPGGLDSLGIVSCIPRNDLRALASDVKFLHHLDYLQRYLVFVDFKTTGGMLALRDAIAHLQTGGAVLLFAHGDVEPEPESFPDARNEIARWSPSIEIILRKVPNTRLQILTVSGAVQARYLRHPLTWLRREPARRQKLAEFLQVISAILFPKTEITRIHITAGEPAETTQLGEGRWMPGIVQRAQSQMDDHLRWVKSDSPKA
jgi:hypothetical protein